MNQVASDHFRARQCRLDRVRRCLKRVGAGVVIGIAAGGLAGQPIAGSAKSPAPAVISEIRSSAVGGKFAIEIAGFFTPSYRTRDLCRKGVDAAGRLFWPPARAGPHSGSH